MYFKRPAGGNPPKWLKKIILENYFIHYFKYMLIKSLWNPADGFEFSSMQQVN